MTRKIFYISIAILSLFYLSACASSKKSSKDNWLSRSYHDVTARDNGYFNARLLMKQNEELIWSGQQDNFEEVLPIFKTGDQQTVQSMGPSFDEIIKKTSIAIQLHPKSKWVDDSYFLIGQANYYKRNFEEALTAHQYIISKYSDPTKKKKSNSKKKKKKKTADNGEKKFSDNFKHQPVHHEASLWIVRSLIAQTKYADAQTALSVIKGKKDFPEELYDELYAVEADLYMQQRQFATAIEPLVKSIEYTKSKSLRARYYFILSQLYALEGNNTEAIASLNNVIKLKPDYVTDFYARLGIVQLGMENYGFSDAATLKTLTEMATSEKYKEFYSLLYYALAEIELNKKNKDQGIAYLNLSIRNGDNDPEQKALSYLKMGDIYYQDIDYINSYAYYDSSLITLPKEHERYVQTLERRNGLGELVKYLKIIETEKQLQYLASLNEWDLQKELDKLLADQEEKAATQEFLESETGQPKEEETGGSSSFYFYNATLKSKGFSEFKRVWGTRKLEDNWRRSDKNSIASEEEKELTGEKTDEKETVDLNSDKITREQIIASLPNTEAKLKASNERIATALYNAGSVYKQRFNQLSEARVNFLENITTYPNNAYELQALYQLYLIALTGNEKSGYEKTILTKYPESLFAKIIQDPDYLNKQINKDSEVEEYYTTTLNYYNSGAYSIVSSRIITADSLFKENPYKPKFEMLNALLIAENGDRDAFAGALEKIVEKYPEDEVGIKAKEILKSLGYGSDVVIDKETTDPNTIYTYVGNEEHYFIAVVDVTGKAATNLKNSFANYNSEKFSLKNLRISSLLLGKEKTLILIKSFPESASALEYYINVDTDIDEIMTDIDIENVVYMVISKNNYVQFYKSKDVDAYYLFFEENYSENK